MKESDQCIGVDLDGTLAKYGEWRGVEHIGEPIPPMVDRVKGWTLATFSSSGLGMSSSMMNLSYKFLHY
jgi:hypothetical protein